MPYAVMARCSEPGCSERALPRNHGKCGEHTRAAWSSPRPETTAERYGQSGSKRQAQHKSVLQEAGFICYVCGLPGANAVDHIIPIHLGGAKTDRANLGAIHEDPCHALKSKAENAARAAHRARQRAIAKGEDPELPSSRD